MNQIAMNIYKGRYGGRRPNAGRPRIHSKDVSHATREKVSARLPLHINFKYKTYIRTEVFLEIMAVAIQNASKHTFETICFTIQSNHIHIIAEAKDNIVLEKGMRSITNTIVKRLKKGSIQMERYHLHVLKNPTEVRYAILYVLNNDVKHTGRLNKKFTKVVSPGRSWPLTSSLKDIVSGVSLKSLYP